MLSKYIIMAQLQKKYILRGEIKALTGIAVGGSNTSMSIGGVDKSVIRNPATGEPYIPGSSIKGKMRSLLELSYGTIGDTRMGQVEHGPTDNYQHRAAKLFGNAVRTQQETQRPSRVIVRDAYLVEEQKNSSFFKNTDLLFTEVKTEVVIDRITSRAMPRQMERVPSGTRFSFEIILNVFAEDNEQDLLKDMFAALRMLQNDYVGGSGSRGSGQIAFQIDRMVERSVDYYRGDGPEEDVTVQFQGQFPE